MSALVQKRRLKLLFHSGPSSGPTYGVEPQDVERAADGAAQPVEEVRQASHADHLPYSPPRLACDLICALTSDLVGRGDLRE